jgi:hypothetical protein
MTHPKSHISGLPFFMSKRHPSLTFFLLHKDLLLNPLSLFLHPVEEIIDALFRNPEFGRDLRGLYRFTFLYL